MRVLISVFLVFVTFAAQASQIEMAITIDDLPQHMNLPPHITRLDITKMMLSSLKKHSIYHVYGFINAGNIKDANSYEVLKAWINAGQLLGNHTYDHVNINSVSSKQFIHQIQMNNPYLSKLSPNKDFHYFRYPYLYEGDTEEKRNAVRKYLFTYHYKIAQVTVDFEDYLWNNAYVRCIQKKDNQSLVWLKESYIDQALKSIRVASAESKLIFQRNIKHILLLHIGAFDALMLDDLLDAFEKNGVKIIPLSEAMKDDVYQINSNIVSKNTGTLLDQMFLARNLPKPNLIQDFIANIPEDKINNLCR